MGSQNGFDNHSHGDSLMWVECFSRWFGARFGGGASHVPVPEKHHESKPNGFPKIYDADLPRVEGQDRVDDVDAAHLTGKDPRGWATRRPPTPSNYPAACFRVVFD